MVSKQIDDSLAILVIAQTFNKSPAQRVIVARNIASKELVKFFEGFEVNSKTELKTSIESQDVCAQNKSLECNIDETLITIAKSAMKDLPFLKYSTDENGVFIAAYGAVF